MQRGKWKLGAKTKQNILNEIETEKLLNACLDFYEKFLIKGLLFTGMRVNEFIHMKKEWIDFKTKVIRIPESQPCHCYVCRKRQNIWKVKVPEAARIIPLLPEIENIFREFFGEHESVMDVIGSQPVAWKIVKNVAKRTDIKKRVFPHVLRGTFASILAGKGFTPFSIQASLGWKSVKTADEYIRISPHRLLKEFKKKW